VTLRTFKASKLYRLLLSDSALRHAIGFVSVPHRTMVAHRLKRLLPEVEAQVAAWGQQLNQEVRPNMA
jgi:hypothetical protein